MNVPATAREHNWTSLYFVISCLRVTEGSMRGQDDASVVKYGIDTVVGALEGHRLWVLIRAQARLADRSVRARWKCEELDAAIMQKYDSTDSCGWSARYIYTAFQFSASFQFRHLWLELLFSLHTTWLAPLYNLYDQAQTLNDVWSGSWETLMFFLYSNLDIYPFVCNFEGNSVVVNWVILCFYETGDSLIVIVTLDSPGCRFT